VSWPDPLIVVREHRRCFALQADFALTGHSVVDAMSAIAQERELPYAITVDHGAEIASKALGQWCYLRGVKLDFIRPGSRPRARSWSRSTVGCVTSV